MTASELDEALLRQHLGAVGAHLQAAGETASVVVVGGAALCLRGLIRRTTHDVDVIAVVAEDGQWAAPVISKSLATATKRVARDFNLDDEWFNTVIGAQWRTGLPDGIEDDVQWLSFRGLRVGLVGRRTLIALKLIAAVDQWPRSVHLQDLLALKPDDEELERARAWVESQDINPQCADWVKEVIRRVRDDR